MEERINTPGGLNGRKQGFAAALVKEIKKLYKNTKSLIYTIKRYDYHEPISGVSGRISRARKKTVAFYRRPMKDVSHFSIILVIIITLITGLSPFISSDNHVVINPFNNNQTQNNVNLAMQVTSRDKQILEADSVATIASIYSDQIANDAYAVTADLYKKQNISVGDNKYLSSVPIVSMASASGPRNAVTKYVVQDGDTLSAIAVKFNISTDTIRYANNMDNADDIKPGQTLTILPVSGVLYTVKLGDTTAGIAAKFNVSEAMIISQNDLYGEELKEGMQVMVPDAEIPEAPKPQPQPSTQIASGSSRSSNPGISYVQTSSGPNHFPWGWCTWWVAQKRYVPWSGNAWQWYGNAQAYGRAVGRTPVPGAIMVTWESGYGHVAYVESASGNTFTVSEMNYQGFGIASTRTLSTSSVPLIGFIY